MSAQDDMLEVLQDDVFQVLKSVPGLALANVLKDDEGDIDATVAKSLATLTTTGGKRGLAVIVLRPQVVTAEKNLPGPAMTVQIDIQCIEHVLFNRDATNGTLKRSSQAALNVLAGLHLRGLGDLTLFAQKDPIKPVPVKKGHVSEAVTLFANTAGFMGPGRVSQVQAEMREGILVAGAGTASANGFYSEYGVVDDKTAWSKSGSDTYPKISFAASGDGYWIIQPAVSGGNYTAPGDGIDSPALVSEWTNSGLALPVPTVTAAAGLALTCSTPGCSIRYTTDGSYPGADATLYTAPITGLDAGDLIRAAAYATDLDPSDVTRILLT
jgi:hypothetical protein